MADPPQAVLSWDIGSLTVTHTQRFFFKRDVVRRHCLLTDVRGCLKSGSLLAIMGPSGAGKTSLLAALSQRIEGQITGEVLLNGKAVDRDLMKRLSGFVPQHDLAVTCLTALEHLTFTAKMKLDRRVSSQRQQLIIKDLMQDLNLAHCSDTQIAALSGGERKRLSLAGQMVTDPLLLFCDEPTTGLDSFNASSVVATLRTLAARGKTVVCSIHQPASDVYTLFDMVCLLAPGGRMAYYGGVPEALPHFQSLGKQCPDLYNPADFLLTQLNSGSKFTSELCQRFSDSDTGKALNKELESVKQTYSDSQMVFGIQENFLKFYSVQPASKPTQLRWLMWRSAVAMLRDSHRILLRFFMYMMVGLLVSTPYVSVELNQAGIQSLQGFHYAIITETIFSHSYSILHTFPAEIAVMLREINNGVYAAGPYYFAKAFVLLPRVILETAMFCLLAFLIVGVEGGSLGYVLFSSPAIASAIASTAYGCCMSALFENVSSASLFFVPVDFISYTFSGLFLQLSTVPFYLKWVKYVSRFYYGIEAMSILQWRKVEDIPCTTQPGVPCFSSGPAVLTKYGFSSHHLLIDFCGLAAMFAVLHVVGFLALRRRSKRQSVY